MATIVCPVWFFWFCTLGQWAPERTFSKFMLEFCLQKQSHILKSLDENIHAPFCAFKQSPGRAHRSGICTHIVLAACILSYCMPIAMIHTHRPLTIWAIIMICISMALTIQEYKNPWQTLMNLSSQFILEMCRPLFYLSHQEINTNSGETLRQESVDGCYLWKLFYSHKKELLLCSAIITVYLNTLTVLRDSCFNYTCSYQVIFLRQKSRSQLASIVLAPLTLMSNEGHCCTLFPVCLVICHQELFSQKHQDLFLICFQLGGGKHLQC